MHLSEMDTKEIDGSGYCEFMYSTRRGLRSRCAMQICNVRRAHFATPTSDIFVVASSLKEKSVEQNDLLFLNPLEMRFFYGAMG